MSSTSIRLKHLVLASLIAAAVVHQSSSFAEAAPTLLPLPQELLPTDSLALAPSVNSDFLDLTIPIISSDIDSDIAIDCGQDQFASDARCVSAPTLIRRNNDDDKVKAQRDEFNKLAQLDDAALDTRMGILEAEAKKLLEAAYPWSVPLARAYNTLTTSDSYNFFRSSNFQNLMSRITTARLTEIISSFGMLRSNTPHDFQLTKVVYNYLTRQGGIDNNCLPTRQAFLIAKEIVNLNNGDSSPDAPSPEMQHQKQLIANEYLPKFRDLLKRRAYTNDPETYVRSSPPSIEDEIGDISSTYMAWEQSKDKKKIVFANTRNKWNLGALEKQFQQKLDRARDKVSIVLKAYIWLLSQPDQL
ncbi:hypothetical protein H0H93_005630 [Arthromyces matolae]|nr:hypothetical protein H0H93_005630 [Arthromyces matolae]